MTSAIVLGAAGFIGQVLCRRLRREEVYVVAVDIEVPLRPDVDVFCQMDLRNPYWPIDFGHCDEVYQLAADVGGIGYLSGGHDADVMANNVAINRNVAQWAVGRCGA